MPEAGTIEIIEETESHQVVRVYSDAGWTDSIEWKPGHEPEPETSAIAIDPNDLATLQTQLAKATTVNGLKGVLSSFFDALDAGS